MLNAEQSKAVESTASKVVCIGNPGCGKTRVLTHRVARVLSSGVPEQHVLAFTFTRKAAGEMLERIESILGETTEHPRLPTVCTIHAWCAKQLRRHAGNFGRTRDFTIYNEQDREDIVRATARDLTIKGWDTSRVTTLWKKDRVQAEYGRRLQRANAFDYDDLEFLALQLMRDGLTPEYRHVLVDEAQDLNANQYEIINLLRAPNLFMACDPKQSIYSFRGSNPRFIIEAAADPEFETIELVNNYRSGPSIVSAANCLAGGWEWAPMEAKTENKANDPVRIRGCANEIASVVDIVESQVCEAWTIGVLGRTWKALDGVRVALEEADIPHHYGGAQTDIWRTDEGRLIANALRLARNRADDNIALWLLSRTGITDRRIRAEAMKSRASVFAFAAGKSEEWSSIRSDWGHADSSRHEAVRYAASFVERLGIKQTLLHDELVTRVDTIDACMTELRESKATLSEWIDSWDQHQVMAAEVEESRIQLMTVFGAKGLEFDAVVMIDCLDGQYPRKTKNVEQREEDLRLFYVGVTRARSLLFVTYDRHSQKPWEHTDTGPSPFIERMGP